MTNPLTKGEVDLVLAGEAVTLKPTLAAFSALAQLGNYRTLLARIVDCDVTIVTAVLRHGLGLTAKQAQELPARIMATGLPDLVDPLGDYVFRLFNGGRSVEDVVALQKARGEEGNGSGGG